MNIKTCRHCDVTFYRDDELPIPHDRCERCHEEIEAAAAIKTERKNRLMEEHKRLLAEKQAFLDGAKRAKAHASDASKPLPKQARYQDSRGEDWIDEFARTASIDEFRGAMRFSLGKYNRRMGRKDEVLAEVRKMKDYAQRWEDYEEALLEEGQHG